MATRRADGERTRAKVLEVALPLFAAHGYAGTSIRMISSAAGVNVATLAYHFEDKEGLYRTVVQRLHEDLSSAFPSTPPPGDPSKLLRWYLESAWQFCVDHREHNRVLLRHVLDRGALPDVVVDNWSESLMQRAVLVLRMLRPDVPEVRIRLLISTVQHLLVRFVLEDPAQFARIVGTDAEVGTVVVDHLEELVRGQLGL
ncbi:MAG: TetR/AcrR family transcriptional regulator [Myxococcota bacterium]